MRKYQRAVRMPALQTLKVAAEIAWNIFVYVEKEKTFERTNSVAVLQHTMLLWCYGVGYKKKLDNDNVKGSVLQCDSFNKVLIKFSDHTHLLW